MSFSEKATLGVIKRLILCVDGSEYDPNGRLDNSNTSNVYRLKSAVATSTCYSAFDLPIYQNVKYHRVIGDGQDLFGRLKSRVSAAIIEQQIKDLVRDVCQIEHDELFFYGFGRGAYIIRAVAAVMHHMGRPKNMREFDEVYKKALDLERALREDDSTNGPKIVSWLKQRCNPCMPIPFLGVFDTVKTVAEKHVFDLSFVPSIRNARHALAFNEVRLSPELFEQPKPAEMDGRTFLQAWFVGAQQDLGGGSQHDGLSLYPLQWMILESMKAGLVFERDSKEAKLMGLAFPQFAGGLPILGGEESIEWQMSYKNGLRVSMFDLQSLHGEKSSDEDHTLRINAGSGIYNRQRFIFSSGRLIGWSEAPFCTIIHPSLYCVLDRHSRFYEQSILKHRKKDLADFQERCMGDTEGVQPWLEGLQLQASGVKAFRILVCGKTGVGKSTLINKVFGVEMTEESTSYSQGSHDIDKAFESPNHPGLLIHDSRGWQAGSDKELDLIAKFLRHRAFQKDPAESLHVIWFCVDSDVSRIEEADKRTFETIAQFSHHVPVFVIGTKKDKLVAFHKMQLLDQHMQKTSDYPEANRLANLEADQMAEQQFQEQRKQLSQIQHYKADRFSCISKDDDPGIKRVLNQTLELIVDDRVRLFCVAAQVMDVEQKIDSALTECMRLGTHAIRTAMVPLPCSGIIGTPTVSRILCENVLQCFGFPKAAPEEVEEIMSRVVMGNLRNFMKTTLTQFGAVTAITLGAAIPTLGIGAIVGAIGSIIASPPAARMLFKCAADMILILERSFRYQGKYVSVKEIEQAATYFTTTKVTTFAGKEKLLQEHVHDEVDRLVPLKKVSVGFKFNKLRVGLEEIIFQNRFGKPPEVEKGMEPAPIELPADLRILEMPGNSRMPTEMESPTEISLLENMGSVTTVVDQEAVELDSKAVPTRTESRFTKSLRVFGSKKSFSGLRKSKTTG